MLKFILFALVADGAAWAYDPQIGGFLLILLLIANFIFALSRTV